jgi:hypothetical protein
VRKAWVPVGHMARQVAAQQLRKGAFCFSIDDALRGLSKGASFIWPYSQELATMLASVWESDLIEYPVARFGVAEKPDNRDRCYKGNLGDPHIRSSPGKTLICSRA